ncbi:hypothetical protein [Hyphomicrobium sp. D-2]|uniref:hypothetical protein n=1 Tax=Hyphomicrobium sp. D-2 TaxID=3041621 RepID=UPI0024548769|nr:hypothetical protein [Hyphomicrobium sp. D-2]MDH4980869.1 hypothetical protein [Hyphomicrobium sp. D-2]
MKALLAVAIALGTVSFAGVATTTSADAHFKRDRAPHVKHYKAKRLKANKCAKYKRVSLRKYRACTHRR